IDAQNPRTQTRHLPAGLISVRAVFLFTLLTSLAFIASTLLFLPNRWPLFLSVPVLLFLLGYSYAKRFTIWCHYWLSAALMLSPLAAWIAIRGSLSIEPLLLGLVVFFWVGGFDIIYACQDVYFDQEKRLSSIPSRWGIKKALRFAMLSHFMTLVCLFSLWYVAGLGIPFLIGILAVSCLLIYEHLLVNPENLNRVNLAFFHVNAVISIGLFFVGLIDVWLA
ncbi:MAG: putative 4-hydroxybenzoate polyprenyltransferase, partial [Gimesia sp.]|nr:putative 4-hydroxybenzoate polyprenyltransferase [Gimesia sp.]